MESVINNQNLYQVAEVELLYRSTVKPALRPKITSSRTAYEVLLQGWDQNKIEFVEQFKVLLMNTANKVLGIYEMSTGGVAATVVDAKLIFSAALKANASGIILSHNHPSGNLQPSSEDINLTKKLDEGGKFLDIRVLDHLIVTPDGYYSFRDEGLL